MHAQYMHCVYTYAYVYAYTRLRVQRGFATFPCNWLLSSRFNCELIAGVVNTNHVLNQWSGKLSLVKSKNLSNVDTLIQSSYPFQF